MTDDKTLDENKADSEAEQDEAKANLHAPEQTAPEAGSGDLGEKDESPHPTQENQAIGTHEGAGEGGIEGLNEDPSKQVGGTASNIDADGNVEKRKSDESLTDAKDDEDTGPTNDETAKTEKPGGSNVKFKTNQMVIITRRRRL